MLDPTKMSHNFSSPQGIDTSTAAPSSDVMSLLNNQELLAGLLRGLTQLQTAVTAGSVPPVLPTISAPLQPTISSSVPAISSSVPAISSSVPTISSSVPIVAIPHSVQSAVPLLTNRDRPLSPEEAFTYLTRGITFTKNVEHFCKAKGGDVYLYKAETNVKMSDWSKAGYLMRQQKGEDLIFSKEDPNRNKISKKVFAIVTQEKKKGDLKFKRYSWTLVNQPLIVLIQFIGNHELADGPPVVHGNNKRLNPKPRVNILPSMAESIRNSKEKPSVIYENLRMTAGSSSLQQHLYSPSSKQQIKDLQKNSRMEKGENDTYSILLRIAQEFPDVKLLMLCPRVLMVQIHPEITQYARNIFRNLSFKDGGGLQMVGYDTQFCIGDFYASGLTMRDPRLRHRTSNAVITVPLFLVIHHRKLQVSLVLFLTKAGLYFYMKYLYICSLIMI